MKRFIYLSKLFLASLSALIFFSSCATEANEIPEPSHTTTTETTTEATTRDDLYSEKFRTCFNLEPIAGSFCYEDGLTTTWVDNANGYTNHTLESGSGKGYVVDANINRIVFRSTTHKLGKKVLIHNMGCSNQKSPCVKIIEGEIYTYGNASYVKISSSPIFDCIWSQQEEFDFNYALTGVKL